MAQGALGAAGVRRVWAGAGLQRAAYRGGGILRGFLHSLLLWSILKVLLSCESPPVSWILLVLSFNSENFSSALISFRMVERSSGSVAEWLGSRTGDQQVAGSNPGRRAAECILGKLFTHIFLCHQAV